MDVRDDVETVTDTSMRVTPPGFKLHETPEERDERIRRTLAALDEDQQSEPDELDALMHEEMLARLDRDYTMSVVPVGFLLHETPEIREERIRRTLAGLAERRTGDPIEHRETLEALLAALDGVPECPETDQTE
ncbi:MAG: hypothetical protein U0893_24890 [Chloroflexota bacterium]